MMDSGPVARFNISSADMHDATLQMLKAPRVFFSTLEQSEMIDELLDPTVSLRRCADIASLLLEFVTNMDTQNNDLYFLTSNSSLHKISQIISLADRPLKHQATMMAVLSGLTYTRGCVTFTTLLTSNILQTVYENIKFCVDLFEENLPDVTWTPDDMLNMRLLWNHCVLICSRHFFDPADKIEEIHEICHYIFIKIKRVFDLMVTGELDSRGWDFDNYGLCVLMYILSVLNSAQYALFFTAHGLEPIFKFLSINRCPEDFSERTKALDVGMFHVISLLSNYVINDLLQLGFIKALSDYIYDNFDYIQFYHKIYSEDKLLFIILNIIITASRLSPRAAFQLQCLGVPALLNKFSNLPIDRHDYDIENLNVDPNNPFCPPPRLNVPRKQIIRDLRGVIFFTIVTIESEVVERVYQSEYPIEELSDIISGLNQFMPEEFKRSIPSYEDQHEYQEEEGEEEMEEEVEMGEEESEDEEFNEEDSSVEKDHFAVLIANFGDKDFDRDMEEKQDLVPVVCDDEIVDILSSNMTSMEVDKEEETETSPKETRDTSEEQREVQSSPCTELTTDKEEGIDDMLSSQYQSPESKSSQFDVECKNYLGSKMELDEETPEIEPHEIKPSSPDIADQDTTDAHETKPGSPDVADQDTSDAHEIKPSSPDVADQDTSELTFSESYEEENFPPETVKGAEFDEGGPKTLERSSEIGEEASTDELPSSDVISDMDFTIENSKPEGMDKHSYPSLENLDSQRNEEPSSELSEDTTNDLEYSSKLEEASCIISSDSDS